jgi:hypothetical protein
LCRYRHQFDARTGFFKRSHCHARYPAPAASPGPCAALSVESPRLPFFDGSRHKASPPANWFNRATPAAAARRRSTASIRELAPERIAPGGAPDGAGAPSRRARTGCGAAQRPALDLCNSCGARAARRSFGALRQLAQWVHRESAGVAPATSARSLPCRIPSS